MKHVLSLTTAVLIASTPILAQQSAAPAPTAATAATAATSSFKSETEKRSYAIGLTISDSFKNRPEFDGDAVISGFNDGIKGNAKLTDQEKQEVVTAYQTEVQARREKEFRAVAAKNLEEGKTFLASNKKQPGVITTATGLQYEVISSGKGKTRKSPKETDTVTVQYKGTLLDGTEFDSSYKRNQPATFPLNGVIKGWTEGLQKMKVGDKFKFYIPAELAYGENAAGLIGPNSVLIFEVELVSIATK